GRHEWIETPLLRTILVRRRARLRPRQSRRRAVAQREIHHVGKCELPPIYCCDARAGVRRRRDRWDWTSPEGIWRLRRTFGAADARRRVNTGGDKDGKRGVRGARQMHM